MWKQKILIFLVAMAGIVVMPGLLADDPAQSLAGGSILWVLAAALVCRFFWQVATAEKELLQKEENFEKCAPRRTLAPSAVAVGQHATFRASAHLQRSVFFQTIGKVHSYRLKKRWLTALVAGAGFSLAMVWGKRLETVDNVNFTDPWMWISLLCLIPFFSFCFLGLWQALEKAGEKEKSAAEKEGCQLSEKKSGAGFPEKAKSPAGRGLGKLLGRISPRGKICLTAAGFLIFWGITLLAVWPGFFVYDAQDEYLQVVTRQFTTHHPMPHVLLLGGIIHAVYKLTGSYNLGIASYLLFQMLILSACFTYVLWFMKKLGCSVGARVVAFLFLACFPVVQMYVLCSAKDALYSAGMLMSIAFLCEFLCDRENFFRKKGKVAAWMLSLWAMAVFRNNGFYVFLLMIPVILFLAGKQIKKTALLLGGTLVFYLAVNAGIGLLFHPAQGGKQELLTVPIQQLARAWNYEPELFSKEEEELLFSYIPKENLEAYRPRLSDPVKIGFQGSVYEDNSRDFWKLWADIGKKAPAVYGNSWLLTSYGFWYPDALINAYEGNTVFTFTYEDSSYFGFETEQPGVRNSKIPWLEEFYRQLSLEISFQKIPVLSMLFSPGFLFWVYAAGFLFLLAMGKWREGLVWLPVFLNWATVLLGPCYLVRYVLIFWFALPFFLWYIWRFGCQNKGSVLYYHG